MTGDALQVKALLAWARSQGVVMTRVTVGGCTVDVTPAAPEVKAAPRSRPEPLPKTIYAQFGGEAIDQLPEDGPGEWQPVVGRK